MNSFDGFLRGIANAWDEETHPTLRIIGSTALFLRTDYVRGTKDSDVLETTELDSATQRKLLSIAGPQSKLAHEWRLYLDIVSNGIPFLPQSPVWHPLEIDGAPDSLTFEVLDVVDVVVSKLKRFHANDKSDIAAMVERDLITQEHLVRRFVSAFEMFQYDARAGELPRYVRNLHEVERDLLVVEETEIELPEWI